MIAFVLFEDDDVGLHDRVTAESSQAFAVDGVFDTDLQAADGRVLVGIAKLFAEQLGRVEGRQVGQVDDFLEENDVRRLGPQVVENDRQTVVPVIEALEVERGNFHSSSKALA